MFHICSSTIPGGFEGELLVIIQNSFYMRIFRDQKYENGLIPLNNSKFLNEEYLIVIVNSTNTTEAEVKVRI